MSPSTSNATLQYRQPAPGSKFGGLPVVADYQGQVGNGAGSGVYVRPVATRTVDGSGNIGNVTSFRPHFLFEIDPVVWGLLASLTAGYFVSRSTMPVDPETVSKYFDAQPNARSNAAET